MRRSLAEAPALRMPDAPRIVADFNYGGLSRDDGRVYFGEQTSAISQGGSRAAEIVAVNDVE
jgi:hypothetical protein